MASQKKESGAAEFGAAAYFLDLKSVD